MSKVIVVISTDEKEKALTGLLYATNALKKNWLEDVKVFFFGPFEKLVAQDKEVQEKVNELQKYSTPSACKFISDNDQITVSLETLGYEVDYIGVTISEFIKKGYVPMVF